MAIGDLVRRRDLTWDLGLVSARAEINETDCYDVKTERLFHVSKAARSPGRLTGLWRTLFGRPVGRSPSPVATETLSLLQFLDQRHNALTYGTTSAGRETVAVPFTHIALLTSASGKLSSGLPRELRQEIEEQIEARFKQNIEPSTDVRVGSSGTPVLNAAEMLAYTGDGVFVPLDGEQPVGRVRVGTSLDALDEPQIFGDQPAGIYRGQTALAFGSSHLFTPATVRLGLPDEVWFYLEAINGPPASSRPRTTTNMPPKAPAVDVSTRGGHAIKLIEASDTDDIRFRFEFAHADLASGFENTLYVDVTVDRRPSRFLRERPVKGASFEIVGFRVTGADLVDGVDSFWFDLDAEGYPIASAMTRRGTAIVHDGRRTRRYSWQRYDYEPQSFARIAPERTGFAFRRMDDQPLGFLLAPATSQPAIFQSDWWTMRGYHLDWLDFAGCVENAADSRGLAEIYAGRGNIAMPSFDMAPEGEFEVGPLILRRADRSGP